MSFHEQLTSAANPLDVVEQIVSANDWVFDRRSDAEMAAKLPANGATTGSTSAGRMKSPRCTLPALLT